MYITRQRYLYPIPTLHQPKFSQQICASRTINWLRSNHPQMSTLRYQVERERSIRRKIAYRYREATTWRVHPTFVPRTLSRHADSRYWEPKGIATCIKAAEVENFEKKGQEGRDLSVLNITPPLARCVLFSAICWSSLPYSFIGMAIPSLLQLLIS